TARPRHSASPLTHTIPESLSSLCVLISETAQQNEKGLANLAGPFYFSKCGDLKAQDWPSGIQSPLRRRQQPLLLRASGWQRKSALATSRVEDSVSLRSAHVPKPPGTIVLLHRSCDLLPCHARMQPRVGFRLQPNHARLPYVSTGAPVPDSVELQFPRST